MPGDANQRATFAYLLDHLRTQEPFTKEELRAQTSWTRKSFSTYWPKQLKALLVPVDNNRYRVAESFRPYSTWKKFQRHVSQVRHVSSDYTYLGYPHVLVFEFFMPLSNEEHLRMALDALFYRDWVKLRLRSIDQENLRRHFDGVDGESENQYLERICDWISDNFGGYSIYQVSGRFRAGPLATYEQAAADDGERYLVDETTAVVRFIFYCGDPTHLKAPLASGHFGGEPLAAPEPNDEDVSRLRWFFGILFVESIIQFVNAEDEVWMVESGVVNRLHVWKVDAQE